jgi:uncharacterized membrane protein
MSMNDIQGVIIILAILLALYLSARTIFLMVRWLVRKKPWVGKVLWWTTVLCGVAALFGRRHGYISSIAVLGMIVLLLPLLGKVRWVKPREDWSQEDYSSNRYSESYEEAMGTRKWSYW